MRLCLNICFRFQENCRVKLLSIYLAGFVLASSLLGVLINHPEMTLSVNGMLTKLNGESVFALMSLLGATIMPHNFYLHSSIVQVSVSFYLFSAFIMSFFHRIVQLVCSVHTSSPLVMYTDGLLIGDQLLQLRIQCLMHVVILFPDLEEGHARVL